MICLPENNVPSLLALTLCALCLLSSNAVMAFVAGLKRNAEPHDPVAATRALIHRRLGGRYNDQISLHVLPSEPDDLDVFELGSDGNKLEIAANSATAMAYGLQWYFKSVLHTKTDWDNHKFQLPDELPRVTERVRHKRRSKFSYYQNVDTGSYSLWAWRWPQWEQHIDWMALNGINMPLAFTGQEKVWQNTFHKYYNVSYEGLGKFFAGSAFLSWGRMGNLRGSWGKGPLPQAFIDNQHKLQLRILQRMREFGMIPALPAFAGHVPEELKLRLPNANYTQSPNWGNFSEEHCCVYMIEPTDPLYREIGKVFINEQRALYNYTSSLYQCDTYMEMSPEFTDFSELEKASQAVIDGMIAADPHAVWLMQGWPFVDDPIYWTKPRVKAYLDGVPTDKLIVLDFYSESVPLWNSMDNYFGKSWIYCVLHNFGGNTGMRGDLATLTTAPVLANQAGNGTMVGVGLTMEGIFQNYVVYDLTLQMAWVDTPLDVKVWVSEYATQRYHTDNEHIKHAWNYLLRSVYNRTRAYGGVTKSLVCLIPHWRLLYDRFQPTLIKYDPNDVALAWNELLLAGDELHDIDTYRHDLVDVTKQFLSNKLLAQYTYLKNIYVAKTVSSKEVCDLADRMLITMEHLEEVLATNEDFLLGRWIGDALSLADDLSSGDDKLTRTKLREYYEYEARNQVTRWGDNNNEAIHDYAGKEWAGLVSGYYIPRWTMWLSEVCSAYTDNRAMDEKILKQKRIQFELRWQISHELYPTVTVGDSFTVSKRIYSEYIGFNDSIKELVSGLAIE
ncbi:Alpha-N-acetylglucosaminidase [Plasmopara halstedii]|uniref:Alpha-N-acetylglucosaminidase n=1 Tax=Plasmopara halstedii TaxID=4781 RepID=A0A0N7L3H0_PLAHL|nr:Alpha-N-acetylglucosaminidase [Plasmopara halstedii]CEG35851.1 Alpha-N-acetylglucosaminidase [Plasmopara halstedii]|eukprot:XP_024572220.1 Alpha-N-acetylglucosaminidase [Plasmopara halstedii]